MTVNIESVVKSGPVITGREIIKNFPKDLMSSLEILTLETFNGIERKIALVETVSGETASVFVHSDLPPIREKNKEYLLFPSFKEHTHIGILKFSNSPNSVDQADERNSNDASKMSEACMKTGINSDNNLMVGGMSALVIPDPENPESVYNHSLQKSVGYLFSKNGPFKNMLIVTNVSPQNEKMLIEGGAQLLLNRDDYSILTDRAHSFIEEFLKKNQISNIGSYFTVASAYLRLWLDVFDPENMDGVGYGKTRLEFLGGKSIDHLNLIMKAMSV